MVAHFDWALALTLAAPESQLAPLVAPGLILDTFRAHGFLAAACVRTRKLRPAGFPRWLGLDLFLVGYRVFVRREGGDGRRRRGLQILGSETDRWSMALAGSLFTHYAYRRARMSIRRADRHIRVATSSGFELEVREDAGQMPPGSVFTSGDEARRYAGPMPFTFAPEDSGRRLVRVEGVRDRWEQRPVAVVRHRVPFFEGLLDPPPAPAAAFLVEDVDYRWTRGVREGA